MVPGGDGKFLTNISKDGETRERIPAIYTLGVKQLIVVN